MRFRGTLRAVTAAAALFAAQQACAQVESGPQPLFTGAAALTPLGESSRWITDADYPAQARAAHESGTVAFALKVDPDGMVSDCTVTRSSGSKLLDSTTCRLLARRARFVAARDSNNEPTDASFEGQMSWILPRDTRAPHN